MKQIEGGPFGDNWKFSKKSYSVENILNRDKTKFLTDAWTQTRGRWVPAKRINLKVLQRV